MSRKSKEKKELSNLIKLIVIFVVVIIGVLYLRQWYVNHQEFEKNLSVLDGVVTHQIKSNEVYNFVNDNDTAVIYMCVSGDDDCRNLEKDMKTLINKNSLNDVIIYLDLASEDDKVKFLSEFSNHYDYDNISDYPVMVYFEDFAIKKILSGRNISVSEVEGFLKEINIIS